MSENKCTNEGCGMFTKMMPMASNCAYMWKNGAKADCPLFTLSPTTSITKERLAELEDREVKANGYEEGTHVLIGITESLKLYEDLTTATDKIAELEKALTLECEAAMQYSRKIQEQVKVIEEGRVLLVASEYQVHCLLQKQIQFVAKVS